ncbi:hypothetical protein, partial [Neisseria dentiae]|uniref:hypothetical protein n=1 Tax=Neisseria dentiae TaxID=194197 RepID=UPI0035A0672F
FFLVLFFDFWTGDINKSRLDTFIVVASLISLIIGNISKSYKIDFFDDYITHILKYMAGSMLFGLFIGLSLFFIFIVILYFMQPSYLPHFNTNLVLSIVIIIGILLLISFTFLLLSEVLANRKNLFYSIWWTFILVLYVIKIYA